MLTLQEFSNVPHLYLAHSHLEVKLFTRRLNEGYDLPDGRYDLPDGHYEEWLESREHCNVDVSDTVTEKQSTKMSRADMSELIVLNC